GRWKQPPRLPMSVPRWGTAMISPKGVTRFWSGDCRISPAMAPQSSCAGRPPRRDGASPESSVVVGVGAFDVLTLAPQGFRGRLSVRPGAKLVRQADGVARAGKRRLLPVVQAATPCFDLFSQDQFPPGVGGAGVIDVKRDSHGACPMAKSLPDR